MGSIVILRDNGSHYTELEVSYIPIRSAYPFHVSVMYKASASEYTVWRADTNLTLSCGDDNVPSYSLLFSCEILR